MACTESISLNISNEKRIIGSYTALNDALTKLSQYQKLIQKELALRMIEAEKRTAVSKNLEWKKHVSNSDTPDSEKLSGPIAVTSNSSQTKVQKMKSNAKTSSSKQKQKKNTNIDNKDIGTKSSKSNLTVKTMKRVLDTHNIYYSSSMKKNDLFGLIKSNYLIRKAEKIQNSE